jgi:hypothetical protein
VDLVVVKVVVVEHLVVLERKVLECNLPNQEHLVLLDMDFLEFITLPLHHILAQVAVVLEVQQLPLVVVV